MIMGPSVEVEDKSPEDIYKIPFGQVFARAVSMPSVGTAQKALDEFVNFNKERLSAGIQKVLDTPGVTQTASEAASVIRTQRVKMAYSYDTFPGVYC